MVEFMDFMVVMTGILVALAILTLLFYGVASIFAWFEGRRNKRNTKSYTKICKNCLHETVCKYKEETFSAGTKVKDLVHDCKHFVSQVAADAELEVKE